MRLFSRQTVRIFWVMLWIGGITIANAMASPQNDLGKVQKAISATQNEIQTTSSAQKKVDISLAQTSRQLSHAQTELAALNKQKQISISRLTALKENAERTQTTITETQTQIARLLSAHYRNQQPNGIQLLLNTDKSNQKGRTLEYLRYLNQANKSIITRSKQQQQQLKQQQEALSAQQQQLILLQQKQHTLTRQLNQNYQTQLEQSNSLDKQLLMQNTKLKKLKSDEKRMNALLQQLARLSATKKIQAGRQQKTETIKPATTIAKLPNEKNKTESDNSSLTAEDLTLQADNEEKVHTTVTFVSQQGRLFRPVNAPITGQFGTPRSGGSTWKGLFFATPPTSVYSIANGTIMYASNLQGYGKTIIVDHNEGYLSIYTGLSAILVRPGAAVSSGQILGRSGQLPDEENGLYFEIRYHNQPMNPLSWLN